MSSQGATASASELWIAHPVSGLTPRVRLRHCAQPIMTAPQVEPKVQAGSRVNRALGMQAELPSRANNMVPTDRPARLERSEKFLTCIKKEGGNLEIG